MDTSLEQPKVEEITKAPKNATHEQLVEEVKIDEFAPNNSERPDVTGKDAQQVDIGNILGMIEVVSAVPTSKPRNLYQQVKIYRNGTTKRLYVYNYKADAWYYVALT